MLGAWDPRLGVTQRSANVARIRRFRRCVDAPARYAAGGAVIRSMESRRSGALYAEQGQNFFWPAAQVTRGRSDALGADETQQADRDVADAGHGLRAVALANLTAIFVVGHVAHVVEAVFDFPVSTIELQQSCGICLCLIDTGDAEADLRCGFPALDELAMQVGGDALDTKDLLGVRKIDEAVELNAGPQPPNLNAAMCFVDRFMLRGKKPPSGGCRCPGAK